MQLACTLTYAFITYWLTGQPIVWTRFLGFCFILILVSYVALCIGLLNGAIFTIKVSIRNIFTFFYYCTTCDSKIAVIIIVLYGTSQIFQVGRLNRIEKKREKAFSQKKKKHSLVWKKGQIFQHTGGR